MDIQYFEKLWDDTKSKEKREKSISFWDSRAEDFNESSKKKKDDKNFEELIKMFIDKEIVNESTSILDIGCGPGKYAIEFGKKCRQVTAIDISSNMMNFAKQNAEYAGLKNILFELVDWEDIEIEEKDWVNKFDLVFASMSPAINSKKALEKMIKASKNYCFLSTFINRKDYLQDYLADNMKLEWKKNNFRDRFQIIFNILYSMGYYPELRYIDTGWENFYTLEKAIEIKTRDMEMKQDLTADQKEQLKTLLEKIAKDGIVCEKSESKIVWMYWKI